LLCSPGIVHKFSSSDKTVAGRLGLRQFLPIVYKTRRHFEFGRIDSQIFGFLMARMPRLGRSVDFSHSISAWLRSPPGLALLAGALAGIYVLTISHLVFSALGTSLTACTALAM